MSYNTKQKTAILNCIKSLNDKHFTIDSVCEILSQQGEKVGRTTVYRLLEKMHKDGCVRKYMSTAGESVCYQYIDEQQCCHEHFHLKCEKCGSLFHMECDELESLAAHIKSHHGFSFNPLNTVIYGVCEDCSAK